VTILAAQCAIRRKDSQFYLVSIDKFSDNSFTVFFHDITNQHSRSLDAVQKSAVEIVSLNNLRLMFPVFFVSFPTLLFSHVSLSYFLSQRFLPFISMCTSHFSRHTLLDMSS
jgi:hypothetical protein